MTEENTSKKTGEELEEILEKVNEDLKKITSRSLLGITLSFKLYEKSLYYIIKNALEGKISVELAFKELELYVDAFKEHLKDDVNFTFEEYKKVVKAYLHAIKSLEQILRRLISSE